jgi:tRNA (cytidine/uridine-2'-O-)-methyltransferase
MIDCALFEPDIPQNAGTIIRLGACLGVPIHIVYIGVADAVLKIPIAPGNRSLNVAVAASIAIFEALRQTGQLPEE